MGRYHEHEASGGSDSREVWSPLRNAPTSDVGEDGPLGIGVGCALPPCSPPTGESAPSPEESPKAYHRNARFHGVVFCDL